MSHFDRNLAELARLVGPATGDELFDLAATLFPITRSHHRPGLSRYPSDPVTSPAD